MTTETIDAGDRIVASGDGDGRREAAMRRERLGRTNAEREEAARRRPVRAREDRAGGSGEGLDELQGHFERTDGPPDVAVGRRPDPPRFEMEQPEGGQADDPLWDRLAALAGRTLRTPKGERFKIAEVEPGVAVTVVPLDGGQRWTVGAAELDQAFQLAVAGIVDDGLASVRLQAAGVGARHPEYLAGIVRALLPNRERTRGD